jgi:hypothetical protein
MENVVTTRVFGVCSTCCISKLENNTKQNKNSLVLQLLVVKVESEIFTFESEQSKLQNTNKDKNYNFFFQRAIAEQAKQEQT